MKKMNKIIILLIILILIFIKPVYAKDCLDYSLESKEPVILIGKHPFFYGGTFINHFVNYNWLDNNTMIIYDHMYNTTSIMNTDAWDEIRPDVYHDGFTYYKLFTSKKPQRYWRKMI